jgi:hypothetical protein
MASLFALCLFPVTLGQLPMPAVFAAVAIWATAFLVGRMLPEKVDLEWVHSAIAIVMGIAAMAAVMEFITSINIFPLVFHANNAAFDFWSAPQPRGGVLRAEGAFGHSIALGASLALAIPFAVGSRLRTSVRVLLVLSLLAGITVTFSRSAMMAGALALILSIIFLRNGLSLRARAAILVTAGICAIALLPLVLAVFQDASDEAAKSSAARGHMLQLLGQIGITGSSSSRSVGAGGEAMYGQFASIDNAVLLLALTYGAITLIPVLILFGCAVVRMLQRRSEPAVIAIVAQAPALLTVALITQYASMFWFVAGLAVFAVSRGRHQQQSWLADSAAEPLRLDSSSVPADTSLVSVGHS